MERKKLEETVILFIQEVSEEECTVDMELMDEIGLSSIDVMDLVAKCETEFGIKITSRDLRKVYTPGDLIDVIVSKTKD